MLLSAVIGLTLGALLGGGMGSVLGLMCGVALGYAWAAAQDASSPPAEGTPVRRERHRVLCIPRGQQADCLFVRDQEKHRWVDVESCSLSHRPKEIHCAKRCLILMNDVAASA